MHTVYIYSKLDANYISREHKFKNAWPKPAQVAFNCTKDHSRNGLMVAKLKPSTRKYPRPPKHVAYALRADQTLFPWARALQVSTLHVTTAAMRCTVREGLYLTSQWICCGMLTEHISSPLILP